MCFWKNIYQIFSQDPPSTLDFHIIWEMKKGVCVCVYACVCWEISPWVTCSKTSPFSWGKRSLWSYTYLEVNWALKKNPTSIDSQAGPPLILVTYSHLMDQANWGKRVGGDCTQTASVNRVCWHPHSWAVTAHINFGLEHETYFSQWTIGNVSRSLASTCSSGLSMLPHPVRLPSPWRGKTGHCSCSKGAQAPGDPSTKGSHLNKLRQNQQDDPAHPLNHEK